jgi:hypothetical protein
MPATETKFAMAILKVQIADYKGVYINGYPPCYINAMLSNFFSAPKACGYSL